MFISFCSTKSRNKICSFPTTFVTDQTVVVSRGVLVLWPVLVFSLLPLAILIFVSLQQLFRPLKALLIPERVEVVAVDDDQDASSLMHENTGA